jgi:multisubunit Na+/H+ antiporter MnhG subunit
MMTKRDLPLFGIGSSLPLFAVAIAHYPGGNDRDPAAVGFRFAENYVCALFQPLAINGLANASRTFAIPAMLMLCVSMACMFWAVSRRCQERATRKTIEIFGIGSTVYTFLGVNTPMHDLLVVIAAAFFGIAAIGMLRMLHATQRLTGVLAGVFCLALLIALAAMRHGGLRPDLAPMTEWFLFASATCWLTFAYYSVTAPSRSLKRTGSYTR